LQQSVVLVGFMAAGKSRIGRLLAARLQLPFVDTDQEIEQTYGCSIAELFRERGEAAFRDAEREMIARLIDAPPRVIAIGGGAFVDDRTRRTLNERARTVWLDTPFDLIAERVARSSHRPLAANRPRGELRALWEQRLPSYAHAQVRIDTSDARPERIVTSIIEALA
jgi:shikimate kinase/3-dehydroquinate synthase